MNSTISRGNDMQNMRYLAIFAGIALFAGLVVLVLSASPLVTLVGKLARLPRARPYVG